jgi:hypothetical protein
VTGPAPACHSPVAVGGTAGLIGGVCIWINEAVVWVGIQHQMPLAGIPANATGLVFGKAFQLSLGIGAGVVGTAIHFSFAAAWGVLFASIWPFFARKGYEATLVAFCYAVGAWIVMHAAIAAISSSHPDYSDPIVVIGGIMSHLFFAVPLTLYVKRMLPRQTSLPA